ncbi:MAG TPA: DUF5668 domain-containing protein [Holophagaceae bacterium]|nr:DUF5668 domain-containing protein [Holophagaceae bacterium]
MSQPRDPKFAAALSAGILLIFFGLVFLLDQLKVFDARAIWRQWPLIVLAVGLLHLWRTSWLDIGGHMMVATGVAFELASLTGRGFRQLWPLLIVWLGVVFVLRALAARRAA